jgi:adenine deaminase
MGYSNFMKVASGLKKAELVLKNAQIINVFNASIEMGDIAIQDGMIAGIGWYSGIKEIDLKNRYVCPGFIDGHVHIESSMLVPHQFAALVMPFGTTSVIADPHEIANVSGMEGIRFMLNSAKQVPLDVFVMLPSCVPATIFETSGRSIEVKDILQMKKWDHVLGLGEVMSYPSVIQGDKMIHAKIKAMQDYPIDGHAPSLTGKDLNAYIASGIKTDHESTTLEEMNEKIARGLYVHLREGSQTRNVKDLLSGIHAENKHRMLFCTDDKHPQDITLEGHINYNVNLAIKNGISPFWAIQMATINTSTCYGLKRYGAIAPGYYADLLVFESLAEIKPIQVYKKGELVAENGQVRFMTNPIHCQEVINSVNIDLSKIHLELPLKKSAVKVMGLIDNNVTTKHFIRHVNVVNGYYQHDNQSDLLKLAVIERHHASGNIGLGLVEGYGLKNGAVAMTIAHDSHNLIVLGDSDHDMLLAIETLYKNQGGICLVKNGEVVDILSLEISGLMTQSDALSVRLKLQNMENIARDMGVKPSIDDPFLQLAFLSLAVIPELKLTDKGLFDVAKFALVGIEEGG